MSELQKEINSAYTMLAAIPVSGDQVEIMASVREHLRRAYKLAESEQKEVEPNG